MTPLTAGLSSTVHVISEGVREFFSMRYSITPQEMDERIKSAYTLLEACGLCPRECGVNRLKNNASGFCRSGLNPVVASVSPHHGEEPPLSAMRGSGTIFFANCTLRCVYCQNYPISQLGNGVERTPGELACQMLWLQEQGCHNLNLVTPTHVMPQILRALQIAKERGFHLPLVYNTSGYESLAVLEILDGIVDIYLPDIRYSDDRIAMKYSAALDYVAITRAAVKEMYRQVGNLLCDEDGIAQRGVIIRHLVLPNGLSGTEGTMRFLSEELTSEAWISLMAQYFPAYHAHCYDELSRRITHREYEEAFKTMEDQGIENGWVQEHDARVFEGVDHERKGEIITDAETDGYQ